MAEITVKLKLKGIELPVFHNPDGAGDFESMGIAIDLSDCEKKNMTFYSIAGIAPYVENGAEYTAIFCNGTDFICPYRYRKVKDISEL